VSKKATIVAPTCGSCASNKPARLTNGREVYPHRPDLHDKPIWKCGACGAYVGCHPGTTRPLGTPADKALRDARSMLHDQMVDPLWKTADESADYTPESEEARQTIRTAARHRVYAFLAERLEIKQPDCHVGMFTIEQCREAWAALRGVQYPEIRGWYHARRARRAAAKAAADQQQGAAA
jgi:glutathione S-transferase